MRLSDSSNLCATIKIVAYCKLEVTSRLNLGDCAATRIESVEYLEDVLLRNVFNKRTNNCLFHDVSLLIKK